MSGFTVHRKVYIQGGSYLIAIPKLWAEANGLAGGSEVEVHFGDEMVTIRPLRKDKEKRAGRRAP